MTWVLDHMEIAPTPPRLRWLAIVIGAAVDIAATTIISGIIGVVIGIRAASGAVSQQDVMAMLMSREVLLITSAFGSVCSVAGGLTSALMSPRAPILHAFIAGLLSMAYGSIQIVYMYISPNRPGLSFLTIAALTAATPILAAFGGLPVAFFRKPRV